MQKFATFIKITIYIFINLLHILVIKQNCVKAEEISENFSKQVDNSIPTITSNPNLDKPQPLESAKNQINQINSVIEVIEQNFANVSYEAADLLPLDTPNIDKLEIPQILQPPVQDNSTQPNRIYKSPPQAVPKDKVPIIITTFPLNDLTINHLTKEVVDSQLLFGNKRSQNFYINALYQVDSQIIQSLSQENIFTSDFTADYMQLRTLNQKREISINQSEPQTLRGFETQQTFIGPCELISNNVATANQQCTLLPPLVVDRNSIEPRFLIPTRIEQKGQIGDVISSETLALIKQPGWQNVGAKGEFTGVDLYFPNTGATLGNSQSNQTSISRKENIDTTYHLGYYRVRQIIKTNAEKAVLGRTFKGIGLILNDENWLLSPALGTVAEILPDVKPSLSGLTENVNTNINKNLFNAANNIRIPTNSFVIYQGGVGEAEHSKKNTNSRSSPAAIFNSVWLGMSPVTNRSFSQDYRYVATGEEKMTLRSGGEGGVNSNVSFALATNDNGISNSLNSANLNNFYIQAYMSFFARDINLVTTNTLTEKTSYYPHLSLTGDITTYNSALRYYGGAIAADNLKLYLGGDYTRNWDNWLLNVGAIAYNNGDKDYYSKTEGSLSKQFRFNSTTNLGLFTEFRYAWDRDKDNFLDNPVDNFVSIGTNINFYKFSLRASQLLDLLPDSTGNKIQASLTTALGNNTSLTAYFSPQRNLDNYGISSQYVWSSNYITSSIMFNWSRNIYNFGNDNFGNALETTNDTFSLIFKAGFK